MGKYNRVQPLVSISCDLKRARSPISYHMRFQYFRFRPSASSNSEYS